MTEGIDYVPATDDPVGGGDPALADIDGTENPGPVNPGSEDLE